VLIGLFSIEIRDEWLHSRWRNTRFSANVWIGIAQGADEQRKWRNTWKVLLKTEKYCWKSTVEDTVEDCDCENAVFLQKVIACLLRCRLTKRISSHILNLVGCLVNA